MKEQLCTTPRGFTYLPVSYQDLGYFGRCDFCNQNMQHTYLVFVLNSGLCSECFNEWVERSKNYSQDDVDYDLQIQEQYQDEWYKRYIGE